MYVPRKGPDCGRRFFALNLMRGIDATKNSPAEIGALTKSLTIFIGMTASRTSSRRPHPAPRGSGYVINVASARNGVGYGPWVHIDGWSEAVLEYIGEAERSAV